MSLKSKIAATRGSKSAPSDDDGQDLATELANARRELAEARAKLAEVEKGTEQWRQKAEQAEGRYTAEKINRGLYNAAIEAGAIDPEAVVELVRSRGARLDGEKIVFGQGDTAKDVSAFVTEYVKSKPWLQKAQPVAQGSGAPPTAATSAPAATPAAKAPSGNSRKELTDFYNEQIAAALASKRGKTNPAQ